MLLSLHDAQSSVVLVAAAGLLGFPLRIVAWCAHKWCCALAHPARLPILRAFESCTVPAAVAVVAASSRHSICVLERFGLLCICPVTARDMSEVRPASKET